MLFEFPGLAAALPQCRRESHMLRHKFTVILTELWWIFCADTVYLSLTNENPEDNDANDPVKKDDSRIVS
jgi:hypothetical protein